MWLGVSRRVPEPRTSWSRAKLRTSTSRCATSRAAMAAIAVAGALSAWPGAGAGAQSPRSEARSTARVSGVVYDSIAGGPIADVLVHFVGASDDISGRDFSARTDADGRYVIESLPAGRYIAGFFHAAVDTLGIETPPRTVEVREGEQRVPLATPSMATLLGSICPPQQRSDSTGALIGHVLSADVELAITDATVLVEWSEMVIDAQGFRTRDVRIPGGTTGPGWFAICNLPTDIALYARAVHGTDSSGTIEVEVPPGGLRHLTIQVGSATGIATSPEITAVTGVRRFYGAARLTGTVLDIQGNPVSGASVRAWGTDREALTNDRGVFVLDSLPAGTRTVEARALGWTPVRATAHLADARVTDVDFAFRERAVVMPTVTSRAQLVYARKLIEFERRRRAGFGTFLTPAFLESRPNVKLGELLRELPSVRIVNTDVSANPTRTVLMPMQGGAGTVNCVPTLWVDGVRDPSQDFELLRSDNLAGIEIYTRAFDRPAQFTDSSKCGAIVVWLRPPPSAPPKAARPPK